MYISNETWYGILPTIYEKAYMLSGYPWPQFR